MASCSQGTGWSTGLLALNKEGFRPALALSDARVYHNGGSILDYLYPGETIESASPELTRMVDLPLVIYI